MTTPVSAASYVRLEPVVVDVKRRTALRLVATGLAGLAGCVSAGDGTGSGDTDTSTQPPTETPSPTGTPTAPSTPTATPTSDTPRIVDRTFRVTRRECGTGEGGAHTTLDAPEVRIEGTATGSDGCATARLGEAAYDPETDTLAVVVEVYRPDDAGACAQCLTDIDYRLTVRFAGNTPGSVRVVHDSSVVTETGIG